MGPYRDAECVGDLLSVSGRVGFGAFGSMKTVTVVMPALRARASIERDGEAEGLEDESEPHETPACPYSPIVLPMISFMISSVPPPIGPRRASRTARSMPYSRM